MAWQHLRPGEVRSASGLSPGALAGARRPTPPTPRPEDVTTHPRGNPEDWPTYDVGRRAVRERSGGICELCGRAPHVHTHHRKLRRAGDHRPANLLGLCHACHEGKGGAHEHPARYEFGWCVRQTGDPTQTPVKRLDGTTWQP
jgi:hypothetical protein